MARSSPRVVGSPGRSSYIYVEMFEINLLKCLGSGRITRHLNHAHLLSSKLRPLHAVADPGFS